MLRTLLAGLTFALGLMLFSGEDAYAFPTTYYADSYCGNITASGKPLNCSAFTAAHPHLPLGSVVTVCWAGCATVVITDRGPTLDLTPASARAIGMVQAGRVDAPVTIH